MAATFLSGFWPLSLAMGWTGTVQVFVKPDWTEDTKKQFLSG